VAILVVNCLELRLDRNEYHSFGRAGVEITNHTILNFAYSHGDWYVGPTGANQTNAAGLLFTKTMTPRGQWVEMDVQNAIFGNMGIGSGIVSSNYVPGITVQNCKFIEQTCCTPNANSRSIYLTAGRDFLIQGNKFYMGLNGTAFNPTGPCIEIAAQGSATNINTLISGNVLDWTNKLVSVGANNLGVNVTGNQTNNTVFYSGDAFGLTRLNAMNIFATNSPSAGQSLHYNGTNFYWQ
jgi:hypothetical protein